MSILIFLFMTSPVASQIVSCNCHLIPGGSVGKQSACNAEDAGDVGSTPGLERSPGKGNGNRLQYFCLVNPMDRETWWATVHGVTKSQTWLSNWAGMQATWSRQKFWIKGERVKVTQSCPTLCNPMDCPWNSPGQNAGVGSLSLLQGIVPTQGSNPGLPHCRWILYQLNHQGSPRTLEW